jgi:N-methylhydantoinase A/oxoprolinase/acetone carboxylase beta subunit
LREAGGSVDIQVFEVEKLEPGVMVDGPALIQDKLTVTLIPPNATGTLTSHRSILVDLAPERPA